MLTPAEARIIALKKQVRRHKKTLKLVEVYGLGVLQRKGGKKIPSKKKLVGQVAEQAMAFRYHPAQVDDPPVNFWAEAPAPRGGQIGGAQPRQNDWR